MENELSAGRKTLYYAIVIVCAFLILYILYQQIYRIVVPSQYYVELNISKTFWYALSNSQILSLLSKISIGVGIVALFALWEKPKPIAIFILLILALVLPAIVSKILNAVIDKQMENFNYSFIQSLAYMIYFPVALVVWTSTKWITTAMLYNKAEKQAKPILISYMIIFAIGLSGSLLSLSYAWTFNQIANMLYPYIYKVATLSLYVLTIIYLKRKLGSQMPFTNAYRFAKKECTNHPPEDD